MPTNINILRRLYQLDGDAIVCISVRGTTEIIFVIRHQLKQTKTVLQINHLWNL